MLHHIHLYRVSPGDLVTAVIHLHSGLQIIKKWRQNRPSFTPLSLDDNINGIFEKLSSQSILTAKPLSHLHPTILLRTEEDARDSVTFSSLLVVRYSQDYLTKSGLQIIEEGHGLCLAPPTSPRRLALEAERVEHCNKLEQTSEKFEAFYSDTKHGMTTPERHGADDMRILYLVAFIKHETSLSPDKTAFDAVIAKFERTVCMAEALYRERTAHDKKARGARSCNFSFEMGILIPIYFVAMECRHGIIRRRAVALPKEPSPHRKGIWNSGLLACAAQKVLELEEDGLDEAAWDDVPTEEKRAHDTRGRTSMDALNPLEHDYDGRCVGDMGLGPRGQSISFMFEPPGVRGRWHVRREILRW